MAQRMLLKIDALERYEKKKLRKYDLIEYWNLGKLRLNPYQRSPLTFDFKLFYEPTTMKSNIPAVPSTLHIIEKEEGSALLPKSYDLSSTSRPELSTHLPRNNYSGKSSVRPSSAPNYLKCNLKTADGSFIILKQKPKQKPAFSTSKVQKIPEILSDDITDQSAIYAEARREPTQDLRRKANLPNDDLINDGQRILAGFIHDDESVLKKKISIPLSIQDELENPNAKIINAGRVKVEWQNLEKMSETFPIFCHHERYRWKFVWNQWLLLYGKKIFGYLNQGNEACMLLNPVLQNNYNDSIEIIQNKKYPSSNLSAERKKKTSFSRKPKRITIQILSLGRELCNLSANDQKGTSLVQKTNGHVTKTITRHAVTENNILQNMSKCNKDILMESRKKPIGNIEHSPSTGVSGINSSLPDFWKKTLTENKERLKKDRIIVDYIPSSKPFPVCEAPDGLFGHRLPLSVDRFFVMPSGTEPSADRGSFAQEPFLNETQVAETKSRGQHLKPSMQDSGERSSQVRESSSLPDFQGERRKSAESEKSENAAIYSEEQGIGRPHSPVLSIPTGKPDASESPCLSVPETNSSCSSRTM